MSTLAPYYEQDPFLGDEKKYYSFVSGVGAGKTATGIIRAAANLEKWNPGEMGAIVAPTTTMAKDVIIPEMRNLGLFDRWDYKSAHSDEPGIHTPDGGRALLLSADNTRTIERLRGLNLAWWWIDEASTVPERAYDILTQRLRVGQYRNGFITTTPKGKDYLYRKFVEQPDGEYKEIGEATIYEADDRLSILQVPSHANPFTPDDYKNQLDRDHDGQFYRQEVLGEFTQFDGLIYPWFRDEDHVIPSEDVPERWDEIIYGVDWGFSNPSVILAVGRRGEEWYVVDEVYKERLTVDDLANKLAEVQSDWRDGVVYCDPAEPASVEKLRRAGFDAVEADNEVMPGIQHVTGLQDQLTVSELCQNLINEFSQYQYRDDGDSDDPKKENDHAMDALRYALFSHDTGGVVTGSISVDDDEDDQTSEGLPGIGRR